MKICWSLMGSEEKYFLSLSKYFNSIGELIENYQKFSLRENFERLKLLIYLKLCINYFVFRLEEHTKLEWPYQLLRVLAIRDFEPQNSEHISFQEGQEIVVISQEGYRDGWWKGKCDQRVCKLYCFYSYITKFSYLDWLFSKFLCTSDRYNHARNFIIIHTTFASQIFCNKMKVLRYKLNKFCLAKTKICICKIAIF